MSEQNRFVIENIKEGVVLKIYGRIDENTPIQQVQLPAAKNYVIDLDQVLAINSMGLRNWLRWMKGFSSEAIIKFRNCRAVLIEQMNILQGFLPVGAIIESFYAPYYCSHCDSDDYLLVQRGADFKEATNENPYFQNIPKIKTCRNCHQPAELDVMEDKFFLFLKAK